MNGVSLEASLWFEGVDFIITLPLLQPEKSLMDFLDPLPLCLNVSLLQRVGSKEDRKIKMWINVATIKETGCLLPRKKTRRRKMPALIWNIAMENKKARIQI